MVEEAVLAGQGEIPEEGEVGRVDAGCEVDFRVGRKGGCLLYTSPSPRDGLLSRMPSSA